MAYRPHRSARQWQRLVDRQARSSKSAREFCVDQNIGYASFIQWRSRLADSGLLTSLILDNAPKFIELSSGLRDHRHHECERIDVTTSMLIEFDLGGGLQLRISRGA